MTIENLINQKGIGNLSLEEFKQIGEIFAEDEDLEAIAKWLHYDFTQPSHISQFLEMAQEMRKWGVYQANINLENSYYDELIKKGYYSDLPYGAWDKNIMEFFNADYNEDLVNLYFECNSQYIEEKWQSKNCYNLTSLILLTTRSYIEWAFNMALEKELEELEKVA